MDKESLIFKDGHKFTDKYARSLSLFGRANDLSPNLVGPSCIALVVIQPRLESRYLVPGLGLP